MAGLVGSVSVFEHKDMTAHNQSNIVVLFYPYIEETVKFICSRNILYVAQTGGERVYREFTSFFSPNRMIFGHPNKRQHEHRASENTVG